MKLLFVLDLKLQNEWLKIVFTEIWAEMFSNSVQKFSAFGLRILSTYI